MSTAGPLTRARPLLRRALRLVATSDLALAYGAVVVVIAITLQLLPASVHDDVVLKCSTNLSNLRDHPIYVLVVSAFVLSSLGELVLVPWLMLTYAAVQHWLGRTATIFAAMLGHVGATVFVAVLLAAGVWHRLIPVSVATQPDVGLSYGLACLAALLVVRVTARLRRYYSAALVLFFAGPLVVHPTFTGVGHCTALVIGFGLALLSTRSAAAERAGGN